MKNRSIMGIFFVLAGPFLALSPAKLFPVCPVGDHIMKCFWTARAELGVGLMIAAGGIAILTSSSAAFHQGISIMQAFAAILSIAFPAVLIQGCKHPHMACNSRAFPLIYLISAVILIAALGNVWYLSRKTSTR